MAGAMPWGLSDVARVCGHGLVTIPVYATGDRLPQPRRGHSAPAPRPPPDPPGQSCTQSCGQGGVPGLGQRRHPGHRHHVALARKVGVRSGASRWAFPTSGAQPRRPRMRRRGPGIFTRSSNPAAADPGSGQSDLQRAIALHLCCTGERGCALLTGRWRALQHTAAHASRNCNFMIAGLGTPGR